jgi:hypothetical protein
MSATPESAMLPLGDLQLYDNYLPALADAEYRLTIQQAVSAATTPIPDRAQAFSVRGPRFALDPAEIHAQYPVAETTGRYAEILPHLVLNKRTLPWERTLNGAPRATPWMALLVFEPGELGPEPGPGGLYAHAGTVADLLVPGAGVAVPAPSGVTGAERAQQCRWIEVPSDVFARVMPRRDELPYLAHCRQVNPADRETLGMRDPGWFSVAIASRLPSEPAEGAESITTVVHLVSLDGVEPLLADGATLPRRSDGTPGAVRLVSLFAWKFETLAEHGATFQSLATGLAAAGAADREAMMLRLAAPPPVAGDTRPLAVRSAERRLRGGFVPLDYQARTGDRSFAWYRGPLSPVTTQRVPKQSPFGSASAAAAWDDETRTFDHSLAAAWTVGRALALGDGDFCLRLLNLHRRGHRLVDRLLARLHSVHLDTPETLAELLKGDPFRERMTELLGGITGQVAAAAAAPVAAPAPGSAPGDAPRAAVVPDPPAATPALAIADFLARDDVQTILRDEAETDLGPLAAWLGRLSLLEGVPFEHLVPDARMLPAESLRFFYLDQNWVEAAVDGALSVGSHNGRDRLMLDALYDRFRAAAGEQAVALRAAVPVHPGVVAASLPRALPDAVSGMLLRSEMVSGWPALSVRAMSGDALLPVLRMERLSGSVLLCLWAGVPDRVDLTEPQEGLRFGVDETGAVELRAVTGAVGHPLNRTVQVASTSALREGRVLNLVPATGTGLVASLASGIGRPAPAPALLTPAELAVQMVRAPARLSFPPQS